MGDIKCEDRIEIMKSFLRIILAASVLLTPISLSNAQETLTINGKQVTRVVIAPARSPIAKIIKTSLRKEYDAQKFESRKWYDAQKLYYFYGARHFEPLWLTQNEAGKTAFSNKALKIIELFNNAHLSGLEPKNYLTDDINLELIGDDQTKLAYVETAFSAVALNYAQDAYGGRINPRKVSNNFDYKPNKIDRAKLLLDMIHSNNPVNILLALEPKHKEYIALKSVLARHYNGDIKQVAIIADGKILRLGDEDTRLPLIRQRLEIVSANINKNIYDETLLSAIEGFQTKMGLTSDGIIGPATIAAFNGGNAVMKEDVIANMEIWRWLPRDLGDFNVFVNIPEYRLTINNNDKVTFSTRVVVGQTKFKTPLFSDEIEHIVVNPYWNVPRSILNNELAPSIKSNPNYLASQNMELVSGGKVVNDRNIDWSTTSMNKFYVRQRPGPRNALGSVKFLFPNKHAVYLHDTPSKSLFFRSRRAFSHGCVRVKDPWDFAKALLQIEPKITYASITSQRGGKKERWNNVATHIPVHLAYFTLRIDENGSVRSYGDIYGHNKRLKTLLGI